MSPNGSARAAVVEAEAEAEAADEPQPEGAEDIRAHAFLSSIDWEKVAAKDLSVPPPFPPMDQDPAASAYSSAASLPSP